MNDNAPNSLERGDAVASVTELPPLPPPLPRPLPPPRRKRRWWLYALAGLGCLVGLAVVLFLGLVGYWHSLIRDYTAAQASPLPEAKVDASAQQDLVFRWVAFYAAVREGLAASPFQLSTDDLNLCIAGNPKLKDYLRLSVASNQVLGRFTFPLDKAKQKELHGRHLNGEASLGLSFDHGELAVKVLELKANGRPLPRWLLKKVQKQNLAKDLGRNPEALAFLQRIEKITVQDDHVVLTPLAKN